MDPVCRKSIRAYSLARPLIGMDGCWTFLSHESGLWMATDLVLCVWGRRRKHWRQKRGSSISGDVIPKGTVGERLMTASRDVRCVEGLGVDDHDTVFRL
ncbi:hypothetical protein V6N12_045546 [Hibiscus sabdariffa]|uniref:Uncharacterized protein n=1 Tax=Hibiscus sabdariffa TaxID=183260 RepID=A0ABR2G327_9ROSI